MNVDGWRLIFTQACINGADYDGDKLPTQEWEWPKDTWLQRRLAAIRSEQKKGMENEST